jgi:hypothetical protein
MNDYRGSAINDYTMVVVIFSATPRWPRQKTSLPLWATV